MSVLDRSALDESPLADLHTIASELAIDGYRRLRRADLIDAILGEASGAATEADSEESEEDRSPRRRRGRRGGRGRTGASDDEGSEAETEAETEAEPEAEARPRRRTRRADADAERPERAPRSSGRSAKPAERAAKADERPPRDQEDQVVEGVVELLANGSGFVRVAPPETSDDDVYISAAQVKRCELVSGDKVSGPRRAPRRSERFPSMIRIDTINGRPADEVSEGARFEDLPAAFPGEGLGLEPGDATIDAIIALAPFGKGSRVTVAGPAWTGKTEIVRALAAALAGLEALELSVVLAGVRPEEISEWARGTAELAGGVSFAASADAQALAVDRAIEQARRIASRGADAVVLIDTLDGLPPAAARKALAAARNIVDGGSVTVIATASKPVGGETTLVALDLARATAGSFPALDPVLSRTARAELLVGERGAKALAAARVKAAAK